MSMSKEARLKMQAGAYQSWAGTADPSKRTAPARQALRDKWLREAGGDQRKADQLEKAHIARMTAKSLEARRLRRQAEQLERELKGDGGKA